jgi:hypothetical protein
MKFWTIIGRIDGGESVLRCEKAATVEDAMEAFCRVVAREQKVKLAEAEVYIDFVFPGIVEPAVQKRFIIGGKVQRR